MNKFLIIIMAFFCTQTVHTLNESEFVHLDTATGLCEEYVETFLTEYDNVTDEEKFYFIMLLYDFYLNNCCIKNILQKNAETNEDDSND